MKKLIDKFLIYLDDCLTSSISEQLVDIMKVMDTESIERSEILKMRNQVRKKIILDELNISSEEALELIGNISAFREIYDYYTNLRYFIIATKKLYKLPNELESSDLLYDTFDVLSTLIYNSHFTAREKMELLFIAIKKVYDDPINKEFLENVVHISDNLAKTDPSLESINKTQTFMSDLDIINERYFMKKNSYEENDIKIIIETLQKLEIETNLCSIIETLLIKELKKRNKKIEKSEVKTEVQNIQKKSNVITDKEYKAIKKELRSYFDFYNVKKVKELNSNEIMRCIELLIRIDSPIEEIKRFIRIFEKEQNDYEKDIEISLENKNIISIYIELYNKLKFYEKKLGMEENLNYINDCLQEMFMCSVEDYSFYKNEIESELRKILVLLPQTYEYEIKEAEKRIKFEK